MSKKSSFRSSSDTRATLGSYVTLAVTLIFRTEFGAKERLLTVYDFAFLVLAFLSRMKSVAKKGRWWILSLVMKKKIHIFNLISQFRNEISLPLDEYKMKYL